MTAEWQNGMFGCFGDFRTCILTFFVPGYTLGKIAESQGESCLIHGLLYCLGVGGGFGPVLRWRLREKKGIQGTMLMDVIWHTFCPCCALIQESRELYGDDMLTKAKEDINRA